MQSRRAYICSHIRHACMRRVFLYRRHCDRIHFHMMQAMLSKHIARARVASALLPNPNAPCSVGYPRRVRLRRVTARTQGPGQPCSAQGGFVLALSQMPRQGAVDAGPMERFAVASGCLKVALDWLLRSGAEGARGRAAAAIQTAFDASRRSAYLRTGVELKPMPKGIPFLQFQFAYRKERHLRTVRRRNGELASMRLEDGRDFCDEDVADLCPLFP